MTTSGYTFEGYKAVRAAVSGFRRSRRAWRFLRELGVYLALSLGILLAWALADWLLPMPPVVVLAGLVLSGLAAFGGLVFWLVRAVRRRETLHREAVLIESLHGKLDNSLVGTLQLVEELRQTPHRGVSTGAQAGQPTESAELVDALAAQTARALQAEHLPRLMDRRPAAKAAGLAGTLVVAALAVSIGVHGFIGARIASARGGYEWFTEVLWPVRLTVAPGDRTILRAEEGVTLAVEVTGGHAATARLVVEQDNGKPFIERELELSPQGKVRRAEHVIGPDAAAGVDKFITYRFIVGRHASKQYMIRVVERPRIENMSAELHFPAYTQMMPQELTGMFSSIRALEETAVTVSLAANKPLQRATLVFDNDDQTAQPLDISGRFAATQFVVKAASEARLDIVCEDGYPMKEPVRFKIEPIEDAAPEIQILMKKDELMLLKDEVRSFSFAYTASDDFGVSQVQVQYEVEPVDKTLGREKRRGEFKPVAFARPEQKVRDVMAKLFAEVDVKPGDRVTFWMTATDNNTKTGPATGRSLAHSFVVVLPNLAGYNQPEFDWALRRSLLLGSLTKVRRNTDFLRLPEKQITAEKTVPAPKHKIAAHVPSESWPAGVEQAVTDYLRLLSTHGSGE